MVNNNVTYTYNHESSSVQPGRRQKLHLCPLSLLLVDRWLEVGVGGTQYQGKCKMRKALVWVQNLRRLKPSEIKIITIFMQYFLKNKDECIKSMMNKLPTF